MATTDPSHDAGSGRITSTILATTTLFGIYIAMLLAVAVHVLTLHDAAAATAPANSIAPGAAAASSLRFGLAESRPSDSRDQEREPTDSPRECRPSVGIDSNYIYD